MVEMKVQKRVIITSAKKCVFIIEFSKWIEKYNKKHDNSIAAYYP